MIAENKKKIDETLSNISEEYVTDILEFLITLQTKLKSSTQDISLALLSERSLAKEWSSKEEEEAWAHL